MELEIDARFLVYLHHDGHALCLKAFMLRGHGVGTGEKIVDAVAAETVGGSRSGETSGAAARLNRDTGDECPFLVARVPQQTAGRYLRTDGEDRRGKRDEQ